MPLMVDTENYQLTVFGEADGQAIYNIFAYKYTEPSGPSTPAAQIGDFLVEFAADWRAGMLPLLSNQYSVISYHMGQIGGVSIGPSGMPYVDLTSEDIIAGDAVLDVGGTATDAGPTFQAASIRKHTIFTNPSARGGFRVGPIPESQTQSGSGFNRLETTYVTNLKAAADLIFALEVTLGGVLTVCSMGILSLWDDKVVRPYDKNNSFFPVSQYTVHPTVRTQNSRKRRIVGG